MAEIKIKPSDIAFTVWLSKEDWDSRRNAWRCPALAIPKSEISALYDDGNPLDESNYKVITGPTAIRWTGAKPPTAVTVQIQLGGELSLESDTSWWKRISGVLAVVSTVAIALINKGPEYLPWLFKSSETADLMGATFHNWGIEEDKKSVSFNLVVEPFGATKYVRKSNLNDYRLVFALRPRTSVEDLGGDYDYAKDYSFQNTDRRTIKLSNAKLLETAAAGNCMSMVLFRVLTKRLATLPIKTPFAPANYSPDIEVLQSEGDGRC